MSHSPEPARSSARRLDQVDPELAAGDGASLGLRESSWLSDLLASHSVLFRMPGGGIVELRLMVMLRRRWFRYWADEKPDYHVIHVGPLVVALRLEA